MVTLVTTLGTLFRQPVDSQVEEKPSYYYLINTDYITGLKVYEALYSEITYKFNVYSDREGPFVFTVYDTNNTLVAASNTPANSPKIALDVYEDIQSFNQVTGLTPVTWRFNVSDITWAEGNGPSWKSPYSRIWICKGGNTTTPYIVDHSLYDIWVYAIWGQQN